MKIGQLIQFSDASDGTVGFGVSQVRIGSRPSIGQTLTKGSCGLRVTPPIARRGADDTRKDAREMALVREAAGDGHFGERSI